MVGGLRLVALIGFGLVVGPRDIHAENPKLVEARKAIAAVRYNEAQPLLVAALQVGGNLPDEVTEIYRLSATTAIVLDQQELAEQYYRRWLALAPNATLPDSVAPKLREPFIAAQAYMAAHGRLSAKAKRHTSGDVDRIEVVIDADPLQMVASVALDIGGALTPKAVGADHVVHLDLSPSETIRMVAILDEFNNHLLDLPPSAIAIAIAGRAPDPGGPTGAQPARTPPIAMYRQSIAWVIPALAFTAVGVGFGVAAGRAQDDVDDILANTDEHFFSELQDARSRRDRHALFANVGFVAGGTCAVVAAIMFAARPRAVTIAPALTSGGVGLVMLRRW